MTKSTKAKGLLATIAAGILAFLPLTADATPTSIEAIQSTSGPFIHNVFHTSTNGGSSGSILAWWGLNSAAPVSTYDPMTGDLNLYTKIYDGSNFATATQLGTAMGVGSNLMNYTNDGGTGGSIAWNFDFSGFGTSTLKTYLGGFDTPGAITTSFLDQIYVASATYPQNSYSAGVLSLWGSGQVEGTKYLGVDLVVQTVAEPSSVMLLAIGAIGLGMTRHITRRSTKNQPRELTSPEVFS